MKRLAWLILIVSFAAFIMQVQPVDSGKCSRCACCQCKAPGDCGMPGCRAPSPAPVMFAAKQAARISQPARRQNFQAARLVGEKFYAPFAGAAVTSAALNAPAVMALAAGVPLFKAHCSFLI